ncbi:DUF6342 family protein [Nocardia inohanensis]|uniref:DUF6342 family protein n=1 Tax=Nocardia inohanensis TaxID=209246 RepID=UPI000836486F|nr:DUF6342 family protein [Nocardia inohanensis]
MTDIDLGVASDWEEGDTHGRMRLTPSKIYPNTPKRDVTISGPNGIELSVNTNFSNTQEADKIFFTTYRGTEKVVLAVLDSDGNLLIRGQVIDKQSNLSY